MQGSYPFFMCWCLVHGSRSLRFAESCARWWLMAPLSSCSRLSWNRLTTKTWIKTCPTLPRLWGGWRGLLIVVVAGRAKEWSSGLGPAAGCSPINAAAIGSEPAPVLLSAPQRTWRCSSGKTSRSSCPWELSTKSKCTKRTRTSLFIREKKQSLRSKMN